MAKTRIIVLKLKKLLKIAIPVLIGVVLFIFIFAYFFANNKSQKHTPIEPVAPTMTTYRAGVYNSVIALNDSFLNLEVIVDTDHINSVRLVNLDEATSALDNATESEITSALEELSAQLHGITLIIIAHRDSSLRFCDKIINIENYCSSSL